MASNSSSFESVDHDQLLEELRSDRQAMATRLSGPRWLASGFGVMAAAYVATAAMPSAAWRDAVFVAAVAATLLMLSAYRRTTGIKLSRIGARAVVILLCATGVTLLMLSVSYGLAASGLNWWVAASTLVTFIAVTWFAKLFIAAASKHVRHGV